MDISWWGVVPIALLFTLLLLFRRSLLFSAALFLFAAAGIASLIWLVYPSVLAGAFFKGALVSLDIALIITGSLIFLDQLKRSRVLSSLEHYLHRLSPDSRIQAIVLAWFFGALLEGSVGFGVPAVIVAPLLVHLGFPALTAVCLALVANTVPVSFGAVGTPIRIGLDGISTDGLVPIVLIFGFVLSFLIPFLLVRVVQSGISPRQGIIGLHGLSHKKGEVNNMPSSILPFAAWSGLAFAVPYLVAGKFSAEIPSLVGAFGGLSITFFAAKFSWWRRLFLPTVTQRLNAFDPNHVPLTFLHTLLPFALMLGGLLVGKFVLPAFTFVLPGNISHTFSLNNPGIVLLILAVGYVWWDRVPVTELVHSFLHLQRRIVRTVATIILLVSGVQMLMHSGANAAQLPGMLAGLSHLFYGESIGLFAPLLGMAGALVAGSVTVSNLMFGQLQWDAAHVLGISGVLVLSLQIFGATAGNALSLINISAVEGSLGMRHQVRPILTMLIGPISIYVAAIIILGLVLNLVGPVAM